MHVGMLRRQFPGLPRAAAEIESRERLLLWPRPDVGARNRVELALDMHRAARGPQRLEDRDLLLHQRVTLLFCVAHAFGLDLALVLAGDQIDADPPARHLVEGRDHLGQQHRVDVTGPRRDQRLDPGRARRHERARDPGLPAHRADRNQQIFEARVLGRLDHPLAEFRRARDLRLHQPIGRRVAMRGQIPAEFQRTHADLPRNTALFPADRHIGRAILQSTRDRTTSLPFMGQSAK